MKKRIDTKMYDTEKAKRINEYTPYGIYSVTDLKWFKETLYRKRTGEFFLYGEGYAGSKYHFPCPAGGCEAGYKIIPLTFDEAKEWYEKLLNNKWLDGTEKQYKELFELD